MDAKTINQFPIREYLAGMGIHPAKDRGYYGMYHSPFREDHIARTVIPPNCNPALTYLNTELVEYPEEVADRTEAIQHRLDTAGLERKIGTNQVRAIRVMLTGSHEDMKRVEAEGRLDDWCADNLNWLRDTYGADNVVSAFLHLDEATPHIHATVVPIVTGERRKIKEKRNQKNQRGRTRKHNVRKTVMPSDYAPMM